MGHFHHFYVLVPKENMTMGRFADVVASLGTMPGDGITKLAVEDPDTTLEDPNYSNIINELEFDFAVRTETEPEEESAEAWPIPEGTGYVTAMIYDKNFPYSEDKDVQTAMEVMRRVFTVMGGLYASVDSELAYAEALTFKEFMHMHCGYQLFSRELVDLVGRDRFAAVALLRDFEGGVEVVSSDPFGPKEAIPTEWKTASEDITVLVDELLERVEVLHCDKERFIPDFDEDQIGLAREPKVYSSWKPKPKPELPPPGGDAVAAWALATAEEGIRTGSENTIWSLNNKLEELQRAQDLTRQRDVLRQMVRVSWAKDRGLGFRNLKYTLRLAAILVKLEEYNEAEMLYRMVLNLHKDKGREPDVPILESYAGLLRTLGRADEAEELYRKAIAISDPENDFRDFPRGLMLSEVAMINLERGDIVKAEEALAQAKPIAAYNRNANPENMSRYMGVRALVEQAKGDLGHAEDLARRGVNFAWSTEHTDADDVLFNLSALEKVLQSKGDAEGLAAVQKEREELLAAGSKGDYIHRMTGAGGQ